MKPLDPIAGVAPKLFRNIRKRAVIAALLGGLALTAGALAFAHSPNAGGWHHGHEMTAEDWTTHVDQMLQHCYVEIGATDAQKARLDPMVKQAAKDLIAVHTQLHESHEQLQALFAQDSIDRVAVENIRAQSVRAADQASQIIAGLVVDVGDVLTPAQRKTLVARIAEHHGGDHG
jgi:Spy/CpxP family protein refolding chaperone